MPEKSNHAVNSHQGVLALGRRAFVFIAIFSLGINLLTLAIPIYLLQLYDRVIPNQSIDTLYLLTLLISGALIASAFLDAIRSALLSRIGAWLNCELAGAVFAGALQKSANGGRRSAQTLRDLTKVRQFVMGSDLIPLLDAPWSPIFILVLFLIHPLIGVITLVGALILLTLAVWNEVKTRQISRDAGDGSVRSLERAGQIAKKADLVRALGMERHVVSRWRQSHEVVVGHELVSANRIKIASAFAKLLRMALQVVVLGTAAWLIMAGELTGGAMIASVLLLRRAIGPLERSIGSWSNVQSTRRAWQRVAEAESLGLAANTGRQQKPKGPLVVKNLRFYHRKSKSPVLERINFKLENGQVAAIVGSAGEGKSTLAQLLVGALQPYKGTVRLGGHRVHRWDPEVLGAELGYLPQIPTLFEGTVAENIARMGRVDMQGVEDAARRAGVHRLIKKLPDGYNTQIDDDGMNLSGGQRQRIALARAMYGKPLFVVLDEPDSSLDRDGKLALDSALKVLKRSGAMVVIVTHDLASLRHVDIVLKLRKGKLTWYKSRSTSSKSGAANRRSSKNRVDADVAARAPA